MIKDYYDGLNRAERRSLVLKVAEICHIHPNTAILYLRGKRSPGYLTAERIAEHIGQPIEDLFTDIDNKK